MGVAPRRALQFCRSSWFGQANEVVASKKAAEAAAAEEAAQVRSDTGCVGVSVALRATRTHVFIISNNLSFAHSAL